MSDVSKKSFEELLADLAALEHKVAALSVSSQATAQAAATGSAVAAFCEKWPTLRQALETAIGIARGLGILLPALRALVPVLEALLKAGDEVCGGHP